MTLLLPVPYYSQEAADAKYAGNDCGPACIKMILEWAGKGTFTVDQLAREAGLPRLGGGLSCFELARLANLYGLSMHAQKITSLFDIRAELDAGRPVVALIAYRFISERQNQADRIPGNDGHFIVVVGNAGAMFIINDPDWYGAQRETGHNLSILGSELQAGLAAYGNQCVFLEEAMATDSQLQAIRKQAADLLTSIDAALAAPQPTPAPQPKAMVVNTDSLNVRDMPTVNGKVLGTIPHGTTVNVIDNQSVADGHSWGKLATFPYAGGFVALDLLIPKA
jgi:hypothetical protein